MATKTEIARGLAEKIDAHLKRFERSPKINPGKRYDEAKKKWVPDEMGVRDYYGASAYGDRHRVRVCYVTYQHGTHISIEEAVTYLAWLDAGNVGRHHEALKSAPPSTTDEIAAETADVRAFLLNKPPRKSR